MVFFLGKKYKTNVSLLFGLISPLVLLEDCTELGVGIFDLEIIFGPCEDDLPRVKNEGRQLGFDHLVNEPGELVALITTFSIHHM